MKYVFQINHPAHYHLIKNVMHELKSHGHETFIVARGKDVLEDLLKGEKFIMLKNKKGKNLFEKLKKMSAVKKDLCETVGKLSPDAVIGTGPFGHLTKALNVDTFFLAEDDVTTNFMLFMSAILGYSSFTEILSPIVCDNSLWNRKTIKYSSYHELAYLHPNHFFPNRAVVEKYFSVEKPYFILRFAKLNAYHDLGIKGINTEIAQHLIDQLKPYGDIYITSERELEPQFEQYRIQINPLDMHHVMAFAQLYIGDSQTMAAEAGVLGVPFVRFNGFVGKIGYLRELEDVYQLGYGVKTNEVDRLYQVVEDLVAMPDRKEVYQARRQVMLSEKIDYAQFLTWFIENYPESKQIMKENPDYQYRFK